MLQLLLLLLFLPSRSLTSDSHASSTLPRPSRSYAELFDSLGTIVSTMERAGIKAGTAEGDKVRSFKRVCGVWMNFFLAGRSSRRQTFYQTLVRYKCHDCSVLCILHNRMQ